MNAITVSNLGKRYTIGHQTQNDTLRDALTQGVKGVWKKFKGMRAQQESFWALQDVSFSVGQGDVIGIVGRNGAGKSTLLKLLSRITEPTTGSIEICGRIASLLEVGTGFHPELSGRENIFLNGAVLGMRRQEITAKFDEIVDFAGVERFLDTPVKRYSSGMYVRLAFAVAAHLEPEILVIDEVLAVGDAEFQRKCLGRMGQVAQSGRTVLFVSHNLEAIRSICKQGLLLKSGQLVRTGSISDVLASYHGNQSAMSVTYPASDQHPSIVALDVDAAELEAGHLVVTVTYVSPVPLNQPAAGIIVQSLTGQPLFGANMRTHPPARFQPDTTTGSCTLRIDNLPFHSSGYCLSAWFGDRDQDFDSKLQALTFEFVSKHHYARRPPLHVIGPLDLPCTWTHHSL